MTDPRLLPIDLGLFTPNASISRLLEPAFRRAQYVRRVALISKATEADAQIRAKAITAVAVDLFTEDTTRAMEFIEKLRIEHRDIPICILGTRDQLQDYPGVPKAWKQRLQHYYRVVLDQEPAALEENVGLVGHQLASWRAGRLVWRRLSESGEEPATDQEVQHLSTHLDDPTWSSIRPVIDDVRGELFRLQKEVAELQGRISTYRSLVLLGGLLFAGWLGVTNIWQIPRALGDSEAGKITTQLREWRDEVQTEILPALRAATEEARNQEEGGQRQRKAVPSPSSDDGQ